MSRIGILTGVAGSAGATLITKNFVPAYVVIGLIDTDLVITEYSVTIGGVVRQQVTTQVTVQAIAKYLMECLLGADVKIGMVLKLADGFIPDQTLELRLIQTGVTTPIVYGFSDSKGQGFPVLCGQSTILASSNQDYDNFTALFFPPANFDYAQIVFTDGHSDKLVAAELAALFTFQNQADADGYLAGQICIDNKEKSIGSVTLFTTGGGTMQVSNFTIA